MNETWWEHFKFAFPMSCRLLWGGIRIGIHAFLPFLFVTDGSDTIRRCYRIVNEKFPEQYGKSRSVQR